jgi:threonine/homoserine/homoserine lactone efflux protein
MVILIGVLIGFAACIPPGPVNIVIISQAMKRGFLHGFVAGLLVASLDGVYCLLAVLGVASVVGYLNKYQPVFKVAACLILAAIAWRTFRQSREYRAPRVAAPPSAVSARPLVGIFFLYISNPSLYAFWLGTAGFVTGHGYITHHRLTAFLFAAAVWVGCILWYLILNHYVAKYHHLFSRKTYQRIFFALAIVLLAFSVLTAASIFLPFHI